MLNPRGDERIMSFTLEDKVRWDNLSPSLKAKFKDIIIQEILNYLNNDDLAKLLGGLSYKNLPPKIGTVDDTKLLFTTTHGEKRPDSPGSLGTTDYQWFDENPWIKNRRNYEISVLNDCICLSLTNEFNRLSTMQYNTTSGIINGGERLVSTRYIVPKKEDTVLYSSAISKFTVDKMVQRTDLIDCEYDQLHSKYKFSYRYAETKDNSKHINQVIAYDIDKSNIDSMTNKSLNINILGNLKFWLNLKTSKANDFIDTLSNMKVLSINHAAISNKIIVILYPGSNLTKAEYDSFDGKFVVINIDPSNPDNINTSFINNCKSLYAHDTSDDSYYIDYMIPKNILYMGDNLFYLNLSDFIMKVSRPNSSSEYTCTKLDIFVPNNQVVKVDVTQIASMKNMPKNLSTIEQIGYSDKYGFFATFRYQKMNPKDSYVYINGIVSQKDTLDGGGPVANTDDVFNSNQGYLELYWAEVEIQEPVIPLKKAKFNTGEAHVFLGGRHTYMKKMKDDMELNNNCINYIYLSRHDKKDDLEVEVFDKALLKVSNPLRSGKPFSDPAMFETVLIATIEVFDNQVIKVIPYPIGDNYLYYNYDITH